MYENNNTVSIDWKGLFLKIIIVAIIVFAIFKGYEYFSNKKTTTTSTPNAQTQLFNANLESLRQAGENYYDYKNYPAEGQTVMVTLGELISKGNIKELYDANGNECNRENSYVSVTNDGGQYKLKATLSCGETSNYTVVMIGCECEENECTEALKKLEEEKEEKETTTKKASSTSKKTNNKKINNNVNVVTKKTTTKVKSTQVVDMSDNKTTTTTKVNQNKTYQVKFDSNGGTTVKTQTVEKYDTAYEPYEPEKDNARFVGWYYNGRLFDFDTRITKDITLEAYYWETKTLSKQVYSAAWDSYGTTFVTVTHKLAIPEELQEDNIKNVKIKTIKNERSMNSSTDLRRYVTYHSTTYDGYKYGSLDTYNTNVNNLARMTSINARKENYAEYDRWVTWSARVSRQCNTPYSINAETTNKCDYGIVYTVVWEYDEFTD